MNTSPDAPLGTDLPRGHHIVHFLSGRPEFVGVGPATAQRMWDALGEDLYDILGEGNVDRLAEVLPRTQAEVVCAAWRNQKAITEAIAFFDRHCIGNRSARKAVDLWGDDALAKLRENPYRLLTLCSWAEVDKVAAQLGIRPDDRRRHVGAVEAALYRRLDDKHTVTAKEALVRHTQELLGVTPEEAGCALAAAVEDGAAIPSFAGYQPAGAAYAEQFIESRIRAALDGTGKSGDLVVQLPTQEALSAFFERFNSRARHALTVEQERAVAMALSNRFSILTGGAGVGKTATLKAINEAAANFGVHVHQIALAGRAAQRMSVATGRPAQTIASWLWKCLQRRSETGAHTLVIVDEASMLDLPTLYRIVFHLHEDASLLLVGDVAQLAPIGYGLTLHRLAASRRIPQVELTRVMRADEATGIPTVSRAVRSGRPPRLPVYRQGRAGCSLLPCRQDEIVEAIEQVRDDSPGEDIQVVGTTYTGPAGIDAINTYFHRYNAHGRVRLRRFAAGDPIISTKNDYERGLWNGSMGHVLAVHKDRMTAQLEGKVHEFMDKELTDRIDLAYAISTHRAQGSQWGTIIIPLSPSRLFDRALLYTALTRAERRVVLIGDLQLFERTVREPPASLAREVALSL